MYLGAKIGVLGPNGAGKSTLLKILAGVDKNFDGNLYLEPGIKLGYLAQVRIQNYQKASLYLWIWAT